MKAAIVLRRYTVRAKSRGCLFVLALLLAPLQARATFTSGNQLLAMCQSRETLQCMGYLAGVIDGALVSSTVLCLPGGVTLGQMRDIVVPYLRQKPGMRHLPASFLVIIALQTSFSCQNSPAR